MVQILTSIFTFLQHLPASRAFNKPPKKHVLFFLPHAPSYHLPHPSPSHLFPPSSAPICPCLQNVMRQACRRKHGSGVLRGRGLLLTGEILLIKKTSLVSVSQGFLLCGTGPGQMDGWKDYEAVSQCQLAGRKCQRALSLTDSICRGRGDTGRHQLRDEHNGLFTFNSLTEHFTESVGCMKKEQHCSVSLREFGLHPRECL